jgi:hypothetical protein
LMKNFKCSSFFGQSFQWYRTDWNNSSEQITFFIPFRSIW